MKKIYLTMSVALFAITGFSQNLSIKDNQSKNAHRLVETAKKAVTNNGAEKATYLQENFDTWPLTGWVIQNGPASTVTNPTQTWHQFATGNPGTSAGILYVNSTDVHDQELISPAVVLPAAGSYRVAFDFSTSVYWHALSLGGSFDNADITLRVTADDGATWSNILWQEDSVALLDASYSNGWETYVWKRAYVNVSSFAGQTIKAKFTYKGQDAAQFSLDNVSIEDIPANDLAIRNGWSGDIVNAYDYSKVPVGHTVPVVAGLSIANLGALAQNDIKVALDIELSGSVVYTDTLLADIPVGSVDTFWFTTTYNPTTVGDYTVKFSLPADDVPGDEQRDVALSTTTNTYANDFGSTNIYRFDQDDKTSTGVLYEIKTNTFLTDIQVDFETGTTADNEVAIEVFQVGDNIQDLIYVSDYIYNVGTAVIGNGLTTIPLDAPLPLTAGERYVILVTKYAGPSRIFFGGSPEGDADNSTVCYGPFGSGDAVNYYIGWGFTPAIRAVLNASASVTNVSGLEGVKVYPNPSEGVINVSNDTNVENTIVVTDIAGKVVATKVASTATTINLGNFGTGIYLVEVANQNGKKVERVVIK